MSLNDLMSEIKTDPSSFLGDETIENKILKQVLALVEDKISEVKNQAVKWCVTLQNTANFFYLNVGVSLGQLIKIIRETQMEMVVDKLIDFSASKDDELRDISGLGARLNMHNYLIQTYLRSATQPSKRSHLNYLSTARSRKKRARN